MALQILSKTNMVNGNTIQAADVSQSIDAFTGAIGYDVTFSGSFTLTGATTGSGFWQNAVSSSFASTASFVTLAQTASFVTLAQTASFVTLAQTASFVTLAQTASFVLNAVSSSYALSSSVTVSSSYAYSSSIAFSSSYAYSSSVTVSSSYAYSSSVTVSSSYAPTLGSFFASGSALVTNTSLNFIAGAGKTTGGILGVNLPELSGKTLGQNVFVSLALSSSAGMGPVVQVGNLNTGVLTFTSDGGNPDFFYTIIYV